VLTGDTCYDLGRVVLFVITPEYPMSRIPWLVKDIEGSEGEYNLVWCSRLFQGGASLPKELLDSGVGGGEHSIVPI
jgi:hypothetical protein